MIARAATGRDVVAICDQPFYSVDDWFIGTTGMNAGIESTSSFSVLAPGTMSNVPAWTTSGSGWVPTPPRARSSSRSR